MNMLKPDSLYNKGMKVLTYSKKRAEEHNISWKKEGERIAYYKNTIKRQKGNYYTLTFSITTECKI